jgi:hypothetical protein
MARIYIQSEVNSDVQPGGDVTHSKKLQFGNSEGTTLLSVSVPEGEKREYHFYTPKGVPNLAVWPKGTYNIFLNITSVDFGLFAQGQLWRVDSDGVEIAQVPDDGSNLPNFSPSIGVQQLFLNKLESSGSASDRLLLKIIVDRSGGGGG